MANSPVHLAGSGQNDRLRAVAAPQLPNSGEVTAELRRWFGYEALFFAAAEQLLLHDSLIPSLIALCNASPKERAHWDERLFDRGARLDLQRLLLPFDSNPNELTCRDISKIPAFARTLCAANALKEAHTTVDAGSGVVELRERTEFLADRIAELARTRSSRCGNVDRFEPAKLVDLGRLQLMSMQRVEELPRLFDKWVARHGIPSETIREMVSERGLECATGIMSGISGSPRPIVKFFLDRVAQSGSGAAVEAQGLREILAVLIPIAREAAGLRDKIVSEAKGFPEECLEDIAAAGLRVPNWGDAISQGQVALCRAVETYCPFKLRISFCDHAMPSIQRAQLKLLGRNGDKDLSVPLTHLKHSTEPLPSGEEEIINGLRRRELRAGYLLFTGNRDAAINHDNPRIRQIAVEFRELLSELSLCEHAILEYRWLTEEPLDEEHLATLIKCSAEDIRAAEIGLLGRLKGRLKTLKVLSRIGQELSGD